MSNVMAMFEDFIVRKKLDIYSSCADKATASDFMTHNREVSRYGQSSITIGIDEEVLRYLKNRAYTDFTSMKGFNTDNELIKVEIKKKIDAEISALEETISQSKKVVGKFQ